MKNYFLFLLTLCLTTFSISSCKKDNEPCPVAFNYTIVDSMTLQPLIGYHSGARYNPELFEFQMNVKAEKEVTYQIGEDSGGLFTIKLSNIIEKNIISPSYVLYNDNILDTLTFVSRSPASGLEVVISRKMLRILNGEEIFNENKARMYCGYTGIDTLKIKQ